MSAFSGLNAASTALWAAQRGLDVTGQNIANVNTEGYSRQRVELRAQGGTAVPAVHSVSSNVGAGVSTDQVIRIRDAFLEARAQTEGAATARLTAEQAAFTGVEDAFREPGDSGIQSMLADVWAGWSDLANNPLTTAPRGQVIERMETLAAGIRTTRASLDKQWEQARDGLEALVTDVNTKTAAIAELNRNIQQGTASGLLVNELSDRRDALVLDLAQAIGATAVAREDGSVDVSLGGTTLVSGSSAIGVNLAGATSADDVDADVPRLVTDPGGATLRSDGTAGGQLKALNVIVPEYRDKIDALARSLATAFNAQHALGFDATGAAGGPLFGDGPGPAVDLTKVTAANLTLRITDSAELAAARTAPLPATTTPPAPERPSADGSNADAFYKLSLAAGGLDATYRELVVALGVQSSVATRDLGVQSVISTQVDAARESVSGVNLDEEMTNMLSFQHAYNAAARMVGAIDEALDTLINRTGVVGR